MILSDFDVQRALSCGDIRCCPKVAPGNLRPTGIRLHLGDSILRARLPSTTVELSGGRSPEFIETSIPSQGLVLERGEFALAGSMERVSAAPDIVALIDGRSTVARLGLMVHCASTMFDHLQGGPRAVTFELTNVGPFSIRIRRGDPIALLSFLRLSSPVNQKPAEQYERQSGPLPPNLEESGGKPRGP